MTLHKKCGYCNDTGQIERGDGYSKTFEECTWCPVARFKKKREQLDMYLKDKLGVDSPLRH